MNSLIKKLNNFFKPFLFATLKVSLLLTMLSIFWYIGLKGFIGIFIGISVTAYLFMSKNPILMMIAGLDSKGKDWYIDEINGKTNEGNTTRKFRGLHSNKKSRK